MSTHLLSDVLLAAAGGRFPPADGSVEIVGPPPGPADAVVAFTAHHIVATGLDPDEVRMRLGDGDLARAMRAPFLTWLGQRLRARPGMVDVVLVADPGPDPPIGLRQASADSTRHARVERAVRYRDDVRVRTDPTGGGVVIVGRGLAGRLEVSVEVDSDRRHLGLGRQLAAAARSLADAEPLFAQVSPGNCASLRAFLAAGYRPIGGEVLFLRGGA